jgi:hypothetical protein
MNTGLTYRNQPPTIQIRASPQVVRENRAPTARFSVFNPKHLPLARHLIVQV